MLRACLLALVLVACGRPKPVTPPTASLDPTPTSAEAAYDARAWAECASQWTFVAEHSTGDAKAGALYDAACCYALDGRVENAVTTLEAALAAGYWDADHLVADDDLRSLRAHEKWPAIESKAKELETAFEASLADPALRRQLLVLAARDIKARSEAAGGDKAALEALAAVDRESLAKMKEAVAKHGWPGKSIVGADGANAAWLLVQHADSDLAFQKECVAKMEPLFAKGEVTGKELAYLWDRVAVSSGKPQRYGTQFDGGTDLHPLEDPQNVDVRRKQLGLEPLADYKANVKAAESKR